MHRRSGRQDRRLVANNYGRFGVGEYRHHPPIHGGAIRHAVAPYELLDRQSLRPGTVSAKEWRQAWTGIAVRLLFRPLPALCNLRAEPLDAARKEMIDLGAQHYPEETKSGGFIPELGVEIHKRDGL